MAVGRKSTTNAPAELLERLHPTAQVWVSLGDVAQRKFPASFAGVALVDVEADGRGQHHRLAEPHRVSCSIGKPGFDVSQYRCGTEHSVCNDGREAEQLGSDSGG